jgi:hypothetical protein
MRKILLSICTGILFLNNLQAKILPDTSFNKKIDIIVDFSLEGRTLDSFKIPSNQYFEDGEFCLGLIVNKNGHVTRVDFLPKKSAKASNNFIDNLINATYALKFSNSQSASSKQKGEIKYILKLTIQDTIKYNDSLYRIRNFKNDSTISSIVTYKSINPSIREGRATLLYSNKKVACTGQFYSDYPFGKWTLFDSLGVEIKSINYIDAFHLLNQKSIDTLYQLTDVSAMFNGINFIDYIADNINKPIFQKDNNISGNVIIHFNVDEKGKAYYANIVNGISTDINFELLRIIYNSNWKPAIYKGCYVKQQLVLSVSFTENQNIIKEVSYNQVDYRSSLSDSLTAYTIVDKPASFRGDDINEFINYIEKELRKTKLSSTGKLIVNFLVDRNGKIKNLSFLRTPILTDDDRNKIIEIFLDCPIWNSAKKDNRDVNQLFLVPIIIG